MYRLASLSSAYERTAGRKRRRKLGKAGPAAKFEAYALSRKQSNDSLRAQNTNLLNIVYLSRRRGPCLLVGLILLVLEGNYVCISLTIQDNVALGQSYH